MDKGCHSAGRRRFLTWSLGLAGTVALGTSGLARPARAASGGRPLTLAVLPYLSATELHVRFQPLLAWLGQEMGHPLELLVAPDYETMVSMVGLDAVDLAYIGPAPFVRMAERHGPKTLLGRLSVDGKATFTGVIVTRTNARLTALSDLRGKRFAFGDRLSTMSHLIPHHMLVEAGVRLSDLQGHAFLGSHTNVVQAVLSGEFDAGAVKDEVFTQYRDSGLRSLARTPPISQQVFLATTRLSADLASAAGAALARAPKTVLAPIQAGADGVAPAALSDFDTLRRILAELDAAGEG